MAVWRMFSLSEWFLIIIIIFGAIIGAIWCNFFLVQLLLLLLLLFTSSMRVKELVKCSNFLGRLGAFDFSRFNCF